MALAHESGTDVVARHALVAQEAPAGIRMRAGPVSVVEQPAPDADADVDEERPVVVLAHSVVAERR